jgi:DNA-binding IclR family transcriptional regulator
MTADLASAGTARTPRVEHRVQSVERAVLLLRAIARSPHPAGIWELARVCGMNRSTAWRLLGTLEHDGLVERDRVTGRYSVGFGAVQIAAGARYDGLARRLRPILSRVAAETGESVTLAASHRFSLAYVDQVDPPGVPCPNWLGRSLPLHASSSGKVFLAWLAREERDAVLAPPLESFTPRTITDRDALERALATARRTGYATCVGELEAFQNGVSAPVLDASGRPAVIVNIWGPSQRVTQRRLPLLGRIARELAAEVAEALA